MRIVVLGGGFGGVTAVRHLERLLPRRTPVEITLVSRENFFMLTPLLLRPAQAGWSCGIARSPSVLHFDEAASSKPQSSPLISP